MGSFQLASIIYVWVLFLSLLWARKNEPKINPIVLLIIAAVLAVIFYVPLIAIWALQLFNLLT
ncbi:hypothetical protein [Alishewanella sp. HL-SH06]|uniref:hypothetical protein n=1 Tax=Alishewanella sp. HL-SH06 TaxID=3461144 RepID=UPI0040417FA3